MSKDEFFSLPDNKKRDLVTDALCNLIMFQELSPGLSCMLFKDGNIDVMKIVLGAYLNGNIN